MRTPPMVARLLALTMLVLPPVAAPAQDVAAKRVYIVHGYAAAPEDHWFPWLRDRLAADGLQVSVPDMPDAGQPDAARWDAHLARAIEAPDENTYFVAHSLGCIALLRYLQGLDADTRIGGAILVSGFSEPLPALPQLDAFAVKLDVGRIRHMVRHRVVVAARDDSIVPYAFSARLSRALDARLLGIERGGHFVASDGFVELPLVYEALRAMVPAAPAPE